MKLTPMAITLSTLLLVSAQVSAEETDNKKLSRYQTTESVSRSVYHSQQSAAEIAQGKVRIIEPAEPVVAQPVIVQPVIAQSVITEQIAAPAQAPQVTAKSTAVAKTPVLLAKPLAGFAPKPPLVAVKKTCAC